MRDVVLEAGGLLRGSSGPALQTYLRRQPGIHHAEASYMSDTVTVGYDETVIAEADIHRLIEECGYHCRGEMLPKHLCAPEPEVAAGHQPPAPSPSGEHAGHGMDMTAPAAYGHTVTPAALQKAAPLTGEHAGHVMPAAPPKAQTPEEGAPPAGEHTGPAMPAGAAPVSGEVATMAHEMGHGGGMSMEGMVRDMRNRFLVTFILAIPIFLYSPLATEVFGIHLPAPFGMSNAHPALPPVHAGRVLRAARCSSSGLIERSRTASWTCPCWSRSRSEPATCSAWPPPSSSRARFSTRRRWCC